MFNPSEYSLNLLQKISEEISEQTFHHHYHILYDIPLPPNPVYLEIGCYAGGSACLMLQKPGIKVISVDIGYPIEEEVVRKNVDKLNLLKNPFYYIKADSHQESTVKFVNLITDKVDLLFIDGDHSYQGVKQDFKIWNKIVNPGGIIVFDDYNDAVHSPEVKIAVDEIVSGVSDEFEIIGTFKNTCGARPSDMIEGNCFLLRKLK